MLCSFPRWVYMYVQDEAYLEGDGEWDRVGLR